MIALNAENENTVMALNAETKKWGWLWTPKLRMWLWMSIKKPMMALNIETEKRQWWLWTPKLGSDSDSERRNQGCDSECQFENRWWLWTSKLKSDGGSERRQLEKWLWTPKWKMWHDDSECRKSWMDGGSERQTARKQCGGNMPQCGMLLQISNC